VYSATLRSCSQIFFGNPDWDARNGEIAGGSSP
jgi:hypothetical protein